MRIEPDDEGVHEVQSTDSHWQESVYLAWRDTKSGLGGTHRIGLHPNGGEAMVWSGVVHEDGRLFRSTDAQAAIAVPAGIGLAAGSHQFTREGESMRYRCTDVGGAIDLLVVDNPDTMVNFDEVKWTYNDPSGSQEGTYFKHHFEGQSRIHGTVELGGVVHDVDGIAWRDHSWGIRRWEEIWCCRFFAGGDGTANNAFSFLGVTTPTGQLRTMGTLTLGGVSHEVASATSRVVVEDDWLTVSACEIDYVVADGATITLRYDSIGGYLATGRHVAFESVGDVTVGGQSVGWAVFETINNPRGSEDWPVFVFNNAMANGFNRAENLARQP